MFGFGDPNKKGLSYLDKEEYHRAITEFELVVIKNPKNWESYGYMGDTYRLLGSNDKAIEMYKKCLSINSEAIESYEGLAISYVDNGIKFDEAIKLLEKTKKLLKNDFDTLKGFYFESLSWVYFQKGEMDKAIEYFNKAYPLWQNDFQNGVDEYDRQFSEIHYHFGVILNYKGEMEEALKEFEKSVKCAKLSIFAKKSLYEMEKSN